MKRAITIILLAVLLVSGAAADSIYVLCQPDSFVNVRLFPVKSADVAGRVELGDELQTDGKRQNGFVHVVSGFESDAWINAGFVTDSPVRVMTLRTQINARGRVACRRSIKGTRRKWLSDGQNVTIYGFSDDWAITNHGFIQTQYLGVF